MGDCEVLASGNWSTRVCKLVRQDIARARALSGRSLARVLLTAEVAAVIWFRLYSGLYALGLPGKMLGFISYQVAKTVFSIDVHPMTRIGPGFVIAHLGSIVIGAHATLGSSCSVNSCVTVGEARPGGGMPTIGDGVYVSTGAKVLGPISIADGSVVGANAVVLTSNSRSGTLVGVPAVLRRMRE